MALIGLMLMNFPGKRRLKQCVSYLRRVRTQLYGNVSDFPSPIKVN
jgi:hypothetical protein